MQQHSASSPVLHLEGLWHPLLGVQAGGSSSSSVVPNNVLLGGESPGSMLLTGEGWSLLVQGYCCSGLFTLAPAATVTALSGDVELLCDSCIWYGLIVVMPH